jgi:hypothetical protein
MVDPSRFSKLRAEISSLTEPQCDFSLMLRLWDGLIEHGRRMNYVLSELLDE